MDLLMETKVDPSWGDEQLGSVFVNLCGYINKRRVRQVNSNITFVNKLNLYLYQNTNKWVNWY